MIALLQARTDGLWSRTQIRNNVVAGVRFKLELAQERVRELRDPAVRRP
jgi:hypothetical protein